MKINDLITQLETMQADLPVDEIQVKDPAGNLHNIDGVSYDDLTGFAYISVVREEYNNYGDYNEE